MDERPHAPRPAGRRRRALRTAALVACAAAAALAVAGWFARDLPRRAVERALAERLQADVRVGGLRIAGRRAVELRGVEVRRMAGQPFLESLRIESLRCEGGLLDQANARFERLAARGVKLRLARLDPPPPPPQGPPPAAKAALVELDDGAIVLVGAKGERRATFGAHFDDYGGPNASGAIALRAAALDAADVAGLVSARPAAAGWNATLEEIELEARIGQGMRRVDLDAAARCGLNGPNGSVSLGRLRLVGELEATPQGEARASFELRPDDAAGGAAGRALFGAVSGSAELSADGTPRRIAARVARIDLGALLDAARRLAPGAAPDDAAAEGSLDVDLALADGGPATWRAVLRADAARAAGVRVSGLALDGSGTFPARGVGLATWRAALRADDARAFGGRAAGIAFDGAGDLSPSSPLAGGALDATLSVAALDLPPATPVAGSRASSSLAPAGATFRGRWSRDGLDGSATLTSAALGAARVEGRIPWDARNGDARASWSWTGARLERLVEAARAFGAPAPVGLELRGGARAKGTLAGPPAAPRGELRIDLADWRASYEGRAAAGAALAASCRFDVGARRLTDGVVETRGSLDAPPLAPRGFSFRLGGVEVSAAPQAAARNGAAPALAPFAARAPEIAFALDELLSARGEASWGGAGGKGRLALEGIDAARWREAARPLADPLPDWGVKGTLSADLAAALDDAGTWRVSGPLRAAGLGLSSADGAEAVEGFDGTIDVAARGRLAAGAPLFDEATFEARLGGFQLLWGAVFGDYSNGASRWRGRVAPAAGGGLAAHVEGTAMGETALTADGAFGGAAPPSFSLRLDAPRLDAAYPAFVSGPLADPLPKLAALRLAGAARLEARGALGASPAVAGRLALDDLVVEGGETLDAAFSLDLPFDLRFAAGGLAADGPRLAGRLAVRRFAAGGLAAPPFDAPFSVEADTIAFERPLRLELLGGAIELGAARFADIARPTRRLETSLAIEGLDLGRAAKTFGLPAVEGRLDAKFPRLALRSDAFEVDGGGAARLFGGTIAFGDVSGRDALGRYPKIRFSVRFEEIDLGQLTRALDFGEMNGLVSGYAKDVDLFAGVPTGFDAELRTVVKRGVSRTITVKAIKNVTVIGSGGSPTVFDRGLQRFFSRYTYSALGVHMRLADDLFELQGLERRGAKELFLKGRLPLPIDIVNGAPGRKISFRGMMDRLRAVDWGGAKATGGK